MAGRKPLNVEVVKKVVPINYSKEGRPYTNTTNFTGTIAEAGNTAIGGTIGNFGKADIVVEHEATIWADSQVKAFASFGGDPDGIYPSVVGVFWLTPGTPVTFKYPTPMSALSSSFFANQGDGETTVRIGIFATGIIITNDLNENANKIFFLVGDSTGGPTVNADLNMTQYFMWQVRDYLSFNSPDKNIYRLVKKAWGGKTGTDLAKLLVTGRLSADQEDVIMWHLGINDRSQGNGTAAYISSFKAFYKRKRIDNPNAYIFYISPNPIQNDTDEAALNIYRLAMAGAVANMINGSDNPLGISDDRLFAIDTALAFDRSIPTMYATTDGTGGSALHPGNLVSQTAMATKITTGENFDGTFTNFGGAYPEIPDGGIAQLVQAGKIIL